MSLTAILGSLPVIGEFLKPIFNTVDGVIDKIAGDKMNEADKEKLKHEMAMEIMKIDFAQSEKQIEDQADARALAKVEAEKAPWLVRLFNGVIRPFGGFGALVIFFYTVIYEHLGQLLHITFKKLEMDEWQWIILLSIIGFFFGIRELSKRAGIQNKF
jgi:hypothetical protein